MQTQLQPVDSFIREGFTKKITEQFRAPAVIVSSPDKLRNLQLLMGNKPIVYPYIFLVATTLSANTDSFATNRLARQGVPVRVSTDNKQYELARILPANFEFELTFYTNQFSGGLNSVEGFARRWLFNRRNGALLFTVNYGLTNLPVSYTVTESLTIPTRENPTDQESVYPCVGNIVLHGYVSEPVLATRGRINQVLLTDSVPSLGLPNEQFFSF